MKNFIKKLVPQGIQNQYHRLRKMQYKYTCPFCTRAFNEWTELGFDFPVLVEKQVIGGGKRLGRCPNCGSGDRERLLYVYLRDYVKIFENGSKMSILHIAPEKKIADVLQKQNIKNYVCGDLFTEGYSYPDYVQNINVLNIPFEDNTFDLILCNHVLEHIPEDLDAMKELHRVLKKDGQAILQVPISKISEHTYEDFSITDPKGREIAFGQFNHVRIYGQDYVNRLQSAGFIVNRINLSSNYKRYGLNKKEDLFVCTK